MTKKNNPIFLEYDKRAYPYNHVIGQIDLPQFFLDLEQWTIDNADKWRLHEEVFFSQWEMDLSKDHLPESIYNSIEQFAREGLRGYIEKWFDYSGSEIISYTAHKLTKGQKICIHTDAPKAGYETHRIAISFGQREKHGRSGGYWCVLGSRQEKDLVSVVKPEEGNFFAFEGSQHSFHAVTPVVSGERLSLVVNFWHIANCQKTISSLKNEIVESKALFYKSIGIGLNIVISHMKNKGFSKKSHGDSNLLTHLIETAALMHKWGYSDIGVQSALIHAARGTNNYHLSSHEKISHDFLSRHIKKEALLIAKTFSENLACEDDYAWSIIVALSLANSISNSVHSTFCSKTWKEDRVFFNSNKAYLNEKSKPIFQLLYN